MTQRGRQHTITDPEIAGLVLPQLNTTDDFVRGYLDGQPLTHQQLITLLHMHFTDTASLIQERRRFQQRNTCGYLQTADSEVSFIEDRHSRDGLNYTTTARRIGIAGLLLINNGCDTILHQVLQFASYTHQQHPKSSHQATQSLTSDTLESHYLTGLLRADTRNDELFDHYKQAIDGLLRSVALSNRTVQKSIVISND